MREKIARVIWDKEDVLSDGFKYYARDAKEAVGVIADQILSLPIDEVITLGDLVRMWQNGDLSIKTEIPKDGRYYGDEYKPSTEEG